MVHASLFSGIGGPEVAASMMGWENAFHCEINPFGRRILDYYFPGSESYEDIIKTDFRKWCGRIDVLTAGFPCQPFSVAGRRKGADDDRYLWPQVVRVIREVRPAWFVGENVAGILTMVQPGEAVAMGRSSSIFGEGYEEEETRQQYVAETVCRDLEQEGYSVQPFVIPACAVGAPHRRDMVFFIAHRTDARVEEVQQGGKDGVLPTFIVADTDGERRDNRSDNREERQIFCYWERDDEESESKRRERECGVCKDLPFDEYPVCIGLERRIDKEKCLSPEDVPARGNTCGLRHWEDFPTQSPICRGDDGISERMDGIAFSKWRKESLKAYGNAIVPQVMYEIFRAIEIAEKRK